MYEIDENFHIAQLKEITKCIVHSKNYGELQATMRLPKKKRVESTINKKVLQQKVNITARR